MKKLQPLFSCYPEVFVVFAISFLHGLAYWMVMYSSEILKVVKAPAGFTNAFFWGLYDTYMNCIFRQSCQLPLHSMYCTLPIDVNM